MFPVLLLDAHRHQTTFLKHRDVMLPPIPLFAEVVRLWYLLPLIVSISLVYGATRHERLSPIFEHAIRFAMGMLFFLGVLFVIIWFLSSPL